MLKLRRSCWQTKCHASRRPEKHCPGPRRVSQHRLQAMPAQHHCSCTPDTTDVGDSIPAPRGVWTTEADIVCPSSPQQSQALENVIVVAEYHWQELPQVSFLWRQKFCRGGHHPRNCRFKSYECRNCRKKGHLQAVCRSRGATRNGGREMGERRRKKMVTRAQKLEALKIFHNKNKGQRGMAPWTATIEVNNVRLEMEMQTWQVTQ